MFFLVLSLIIFYLPNVIGQLWPLEFINSLKYAICWNSPEYFQNNDKTISSIISYFLFFIITFIIKDIILGNTKIVKSYHYGFNQQVTNIIQWLVGTSETLRVQKSQINHIHDKEDQFNQWLAGLIDGDGYLTVNKNNLSLCEITVALADEKILRLIQDKVGGKVALRSGIKAIRIRIWRKKDIIDLVNRINGNIRNTVRFSQLSRVCSHLNIPIKNPQKEIIPIPWFIGILDTHGTINFYPHYTQNILYRYQLTISVYQKHLTNIEAFQNKFGGHIYYDKSGTGGYHWKINSKTEHLNFYKEFIKYPCKSIKANRLFLIPKYYDLVNLKAFKSDENSSIYKAWTNFVKKWNMI